MVRTIKFIWRPSIGQGLCLYSGDKGPCHVVAHRLPEFTVSTGGNDGDS
jgi:hypothetical protein